MLFSVLSAMLALLLDLLHAATRGEHDKTIEIVALRHQLRLYERTASRKPRLARWDKVVLATIVAKYRVLTRPGAGAARDRPPLASRDREAAMDLRHHAETRPPGHAGRHRRIDRALRAREPRLGLRQAPGRVAEGGPPPLPGHD